MDKDAKKSGAQGGERIAKVMARVGLCSRRQAEAWISEGRVEVNGKVLKSPAFNVTPNDKIMVDGKHLPNREATRMWLYHKPSERMVTENDPDGRRTIFDDFAQSDLPRIVTIGRLDFNTEGLLMLTNDGGLKRVLELPSTGWVRRYRVRAFGNIDQPALDKLKNGITVDGVKYGEIEATLERVQGRNVWLLVGLREGKNREIKVVLSALGLEVNRLIRVSYGPFQLGDLKIGGIQEVRRKVLRDQLGKKLVDASGANFDDIVPARPVLNPKARVYKKGGAVSRTPPRPVPDRGLVSAPYYKKPEKKPDPAEERGKYQDRNDRNRNQDRDRPSRDGKPAAQSGERQKKVFYSDGRSENYQPRPQRGDKRGRDDDAGRDGKKSFGGKKDFGDRPSRGRDDDRGGKSRDGQGRDGGKRFDSKPGGRPRSKSGSSQPKRRI